MSLPWHLAQWTSGENLTEVLDCGSCTRAEREPRHALRWARYKCCTFQPYVANYNCLGASANRNSVFLPIGLVARREYQELYHSTLESEKGENLLCSNYDLQTRQCRTWSSRPAECATFYCESQHAEGLEKWRQRSHQYYQIEVGVAQMAMLEMGYDSREIAEMISWIHRPVNFTTYRARLAWAHWFGREEEYFRKCRTWAETISREQVAEWMRST